MKRAALFTLPLLVLCGELAAAPFVAADPVLATGGVVRIEAGRMRQVEFKPLPVEPGKCYHLVFEARVDGGIALENNPRVHVARFEQSHLFWRWQIRQSSASNTPCSSRCIPPMTLFSSGWRTYHDLVRAGPRAATVAVAFVPPGLPAGLELRDVRLEPYDNGKAVNLNGDFSLGEDCLAGWGRPLDAAGFRTVKGRRVFDTAYGTESLPFPVDDATAYHVALKRTTYGGYTACNIYFRDAGKQVLKLVTVNGASFDFVPPEGAVEAYFKIYNSYLESVVVTLSGPKGILRKE